MFRRLAVVLILCGCSGDPEVATRSGKLVGGTGPLPGAIQGMRYRAGDHAGYTDADGRYTYADGDRVTFSVGAVTFEPSVGRAFVSPFQLANGSGCAVGDALTHVLQILQSVDQNDNLDDGIQLPELPPASSPMSPADVTAAVQAVRAGATVVAPDVALDRFIRQIDSQEWIDEPGDKFGLVDSTHRSQGVATDGKSWFFSSANHLERTDSAFEVQAANVTPIPADIASQGGNHIGDIDVLDGLLYAPIEDGSAYLHPYIVTYHADTLEPTGDEWLLPQALLTKGVPWVAVDGPRRVLYTAEWDPTQRINVFDLDNDLSLVKTIELSSTIGRIQGAKVFGGELYASSDDNDKTIYEIDLDTGTVMTLFTLGTTGSEAEGLALVSASHVARMRILDVVIPNVQLFQRRRTRDPLRDAICP